MAVYPEIHADIESGVKNVGVAGVDAVAIVGSGYARAPRIGSTVKGWGVNFRFVFLRPTSIEAIIVRKIVVDTDGVLIGMRGRGRGLRKVVNEGVGVCGTGPIVTRGDALGNCVHQI